MDKRANWSSSTPHKNKPGVAIVDAAIAELLLRFRSYAPKTSKDGIPEKSAYKFDYKTYQWKKKVVP